MKHCIFILLAFLFFTDNIIAQENNTQVNFTDENGLKQGYWKKVYRNGNIAYEGTFKNNRPIGEFKRYDMNGDLQVILNYTETSPKVKAKILYPRGEKKAEGVYIDKKKDSTWTFYSKKGNIISTIAYQNNQKHGEEISYYINGAVASKLNWKNDILDGDWEQYHYSGGLSIKMHLKNGMREGKYIVYDKNGKEIIFGFYKDNVREGKWFFKNPDSPGETTITYINGVAENQEELERMESKLLEQYDKNKGKYTEPTEDSIFR